MGYVAEIYGTSSVVERSDFDESVDVWLRIDVKTVLILNPNLKAYQAKFVLEIGVGLYSFDVIDPGLFWWTIGYRLEVWNSGEIANSIIHSVKMIKKKRNSGRYGASRFGSHGFKAACSVSQCLYGDRVFRQMVGDDLIIVHKAGMAGHQWVCLDFMEPLQVFLFFAVVLLRLCRSEDLLQSPLC